MANTTLLKAGNVQTVNGVTYFKLRSEFEGDYTKNCGLLGEEIDQNFYFLRGYDIKSVELDDDNNLVIKRLSDNYEPIVVEFGDMLGQPLFEFDAKEGVLTIIYPSGETEELAGFMVPGKDIKISTDSTIDGDGTASNPLGISVVERTGTYAPAAEYFDLTGGEEMPEGKEKGYRIVTKEKVDNFGKLYPFGALEILQEKLENESSEWRVPTKEDWDELLNAMECEEDRNHDGVRAGEYGKLAGRALKSTDDIWKDYPVEPWEEPVVGLDTVGFKALPLGRCPQRVAMMTDPDNDAEGFTEFASFWANTTEEVSGDAYAKSMSYRRGGIIQEALGHSAMLSVRLVKDYNVSNFNQFETILGLNYETTLVKSPYDDCDYIKIWTVQNVYDPSEVLSGVTSEQWSAVTGDVKNEKEVYFINEWTGTKWIKKLMADGDSVVIADYEDAPYHEWRVIDGVLIDTVQAVLDEVREELNEIENRIDNIDTEISEITENLNELSGSTVEIDNAINEFSASTVGEIERIDTELTRLDGNDITSGEFVLDGDSDSEVVIKRNDGSDAVKLKVSNDFFDFGTF